MANQKICLDTTALIDVLRNLQTAVEKVRELRENGCDLHTASINAFELYTGTYLTNPSKSLPPVEGMLEELKILDFTPKEGKEAGCSTPTLNGEEKKRRSEMC